FFFQAEDGIRDLTVTGVQTCALPILGSPEDVPLRDAINHGVVPGPRILTAVNPLSDEKLTPDQIREFVRKVKADGADVLKIFARSEERRVGKECRSWEWPCGWKGEWW